MMKLRPLGLLGLLGMHVWWAFALPLFAQQLELEIGGRKMTVKGDRRAGITYYSVRDLARHFSLSYRESGSMLTLTGPRGNLDLVADRPLVRVGEQYILLSGSVWLKRRGDWWVPADFLEKALASVLDRGLVRSGPGSLRVEDQGENLINVRFIRYPEHLSVVFEGTQKAGVEIREFRNYIEVLFNDFLVRPQVIGRSPWAELLSSVEFESQEAMGAFRLAKGSAYERFRQYELADPPRLIVDVFPLSSSPAGLSSPAGGGAPARDTSGTEVSRDSGAAAVPTDMVIIDPGHGGGDYGVDAELGRTLFEETEADVPVSLLEKSLALQISRAIESRLGSEGLSGRLTRNRDVSVDLSYRSAVANRAEVFVTLHFGAALSPAPRGPIVYVFETSERTRDRGSDEGTGISSEAEEEQILTPWTEAQEGYTEESRRLALLLQRDLNLLFGVDNSIVHAPIAVLASVAAPAVLIEAGFLTNPQDRSLLSSSDFQQRLVETIASSIRNFVRSR